MARRDFFKKTQQRRYQSRSYRNPHIRETKRLNWKLLSLVSLSTLGSISLVGFLLAHPWFRIEHVEILGTEYLDRGSFERDIRTYIQETPFFIFERSNRFLFSPEDLSAMLLTNFALASINIGLREGQLYITLEERTSNLLWRTEDKLFVVDLEGVVVREITDPEDEIFQQSNLSELPIFIDKNDTPVHVGSTVLKKEEVDQAFLFLGLLQEAGISYSYIDVDRVAGKWVKLMTTDGYSILFDLTGDIQNQYENLAIILTNQVKDTSTLEYIDLRFGDKVYFK